MSDEVSKSSGRILVGYSDDRWADEDLFIGSGFSKEADIEPDYFWCRASVRFNKSAFQKHKLKNVLSKFDSSLSDIENCHNNGYWRVWDCGSTKWVKR